MRDATFLSLENHSEKRIEKFGLLACCALRDSQ